MPTTCTYDRNELTRDACFINGQWLAADDGRCSAVYNPATQTCIGQVPQMGAAEAQRAVDAAAAALPAWRARTANDRAAILLRWHQLINEHRELLAEILTAEQGKPLADARGEITYGNNYIEWYAHEARRIRGEIIPASSPTQRVMVLKQAIGVVAAITPWNFPSAMITRKCAPALASGCTVVIKPAPDTPLSALALCVLAEHAGFPAGVINCVTGDAHAIGAVLCASSAVRCLSFTGSTAVGKILLQQSAQTVKRMALELGGNAPFIVCEDADIAHAVAGAIACKFRNSGQACVAANRFYVHQQIHDVFITALLTAMQQLSLGDGINPAHNQGPLINLAATEKVQRLVDNAIAHGAQLHCGGKIDPQLGGTFYQPTLLSQITDIMDIRHQEIFGPVIAISSFTNDNDVITAANNTNAGLAAYAYTTNAQRQLRFSEQLAYGMVGINEALLSNEAAPFGGIKESGLGREGSQYGIDDFIELKYVLIGNVDA